MTKKVLVVVVIALFLVVVGCKSTSIHSTGGVVNGFSDSERDQLLLQKATDYVDDTYCDEIKSNAMRDVCYNNIVLAKNDITICEKLSDNTVGGCIKRFAMQSKDVEQCELVEQGDLCYKEMALATDNIELCSGIENQQMKDSCVKGVAESLDNAEFCMDIKSDNEKERCISNIALGSNNPELCDMLPHLLKESTCYHVIANKLNDVSICGRITLSDIRADCYNELK